MRAQVRVAELSVIPEGAAGATPRRRQVYPSFSKIMWIYVAANNNQHSAEIIVTRAAVGIPISVFAIKCRPISGAMNRFIACAELYGLRGQGPAKQDPRRRGDDPRRRICRLDAYLACCMILVQRSTTGRTLSALSGGNIGTSRATPISARRFTLSAAYRDVQRPCQLSRSNRSCSSLNYLDPGCKPLGRRAL